MSKKVKTGLETVQEIVDGAQLVPFQDHLAIVFTKASEGHLEAECILSAQKHGNGFNGNVHGGVIASFADAVGGFCFVTALDNEQKPFVADLAIKFVRPTIVEGAVLKAVADIKTMNDKKSNGIIDVEIKQGETIVALARCTAVVPRMV